MHDPIDGLLALAERSWFRMEAKELIAHCLDEGDLSPFDEMLEPLVLAGAHSIALLQEILEEIRATRSTLSSQGLGVRQDLIDAFKQFGLRIPAELVTDTPDVYRTICGQGLQREVRRAASRLAVEEEGLLAEICAAAGERVTVLAHKMVLLSRIEAAVEDWFSGMAYEAHRQGDPTRNTHPRAKAH